jgi:hypothetical protein
MSTLVFQTNMSGAPLLQIFVLYSFVVIVLCAISTSSSLALLDFANLSDASISELFANHVNTNLRNTDHERRWAGPSPNPATQEVWKNFKCKGRKFVAQVSYSDYDIGQILPTAANTAASPRFFRTSTSSLILFRCLFRRLTGIMGLCDVRRRRSVP